MIAINLLPGAKRKRGAKGPSLALPDVKQLLAFTKDPWLVAAIAGWVVAATFVGLMYLPRRQQLGALQPRLEELLRDSTRLQQVLVTKAEAEARRDSLLRQMEVIRAIDQQRYVWPHVLDEVARALPPFVWLDEIAPRAASQDSGAAGAVPQMAFTINGKSADIQAITRFQRNLEESPFVTEVTLGNTGQTNEQGRDVNTFVINANYQQPDSTRLTMQPLAASLVQGFRSGVTRRR